MSRRPVFRRKRHAPECRPRLGEFQADLPLSGSRGTKKRHAAFLLFVRLPMLHQRTLLPFVSRACSSTSAPCALIASVDASSSNFLPCVRVAYAHRYLHQYPLTPPAWTWIRVRIRRCGRETSFTVQYTVHQSKVDGRRVCAYAKSTRSGRQGGK